METSEHLLRVLTAVAVLGNRDVAGLAFRLSFHLVAAVGRFYRRAGRRFCRPG